MNVPRSPLPLLGIVALAVLLLVGTAWLATPTDLALRYLAPDALTIESSTGNNALLPLASTEGAGLMSTAHVQALEDHGVIVSGVLVLGESLTLRTSTGRTVIIDVVAPGEAGGLARANDQGR